MSPHVLEGVKGHWLGDECLILDLDSNIWNMFGLGCCPAKDSCRELKPQVGDGSHRTWMRHPPSYESKILRNVCVYVLAYDLHRFEIEMILVKLYKPIRVLESILWSKNQGTQINNPGKNGDELKPRISDESPGVLAYDLHRYEVEMILHQTSQIH